ncbi:MAG: hypothetical protein ACI8X5_002093 [Planctomycetota bacterium]|jgi:hypothetical protein
MSSFEIREVQVSDLASLLECARESFGGERAKTAAQWKWAFDRPGIARHGIVALEAERVIAAYLGIAQKMWIGGEERLCVQAVDLMVHPDYRRGKQPRGLYAEVAEAFIGDYGTRGEDVFHYGWPIDAARRSGQRLLGYELLREELCLVRKLEDAPLHMPKCVNVVTDFGDDLRWLWDRCTADWGAAAIRDSDWVRWRFLERPGHEYCLLGLRDDNVLRGLAVLRKTAWDWEGAVALCDWLVPDDEPETARQMDRAIRHQAHSWGARSLVALFPQTSRPFASFQDRDWRVQHSPFKLVARSYDVRFDADWLRAHWWYSLADSDLA